MKQDLPNRDNWPRWMFLLIGTCALVLLSWDFNDTDKSIIGLNQEEVGSNYGSPDYSHLIELHTGTLLYEHAGGIMKWYFDSGRQDTVQIKELGWEGPIWNIVVWLHSEEGEWITIDHLQYPIGVVF